MMIDSIRVYTKLNALVLTGGRLEGKTQGF